MNGVSSVARYCLSAAVTRLGIFAFFIAITTGCSGLFFFPSTQLFTTPRQLGLKHEERKFKTPDGETLGAWYLPAVGEERGVILFLHGNAENRSTHIHSAKWLPGAGYSVLLLDYRGFGDSSGSATRARSVRDVIFVLQQIREWENVQCHGLIVYGQSLGGAIAVQALRAYSELSKEGPNNVASIDPVLSLVLEGAFASYQQIAREKLQMVWLTYPFAYPISFLVGGVTSPEEDLAKLPTLPIFIAARADDPIVGSQHSTQLAVVARQPKELLLLPGSGHTDVFISPAEQFKLLKFFQQNLSAKTCFRQ